MSFRIKKRICILLISLLILLAIIPTVLLKKEQPEGEYITKDEVVVLTELLHTVLENDVSDTGEGNEEVSEQKEIIEFVQENADQREVVENLQELVSGWKVKEYITYGHFLQWKEAADREFDVLPEDEKKELSAKYRKSFYMTKADWYSYFEELCQKMDTEGKITTEELTVLGDAANVVDIEGTPIEENYVFTQNGRWEKKLEEEFIPMQQKATYIIYGDALWGVYNIQPEAELANVWIVENTEEELTYFYKNYKVVTAKKEGSFSEREQVADLRFENGSLESVAVKTQKISGKVLKLSSGEVEIEGVGTYSLAENAQYYRLYDRLENAGRSEVRLGYNFTDFVIDEGEIQAALLVKDEKMENIRVLIKNSEFDGYYHEEIVARANVDMELVYGEDRIEIAAGEVLTLYPDSEYFVTNRVYLKPKALTGRTVFTNIERNNGGQGYYGSFELEKRDEGILLINEVLLEEYLYAVVPSEMPGYYPLEALKAQAISARTYAYNKMLSSGLGSYGAHLDDSATYQVYNNIKEHVNTTTAVKETRGEILYAGEALAETYYYSTSCGFGTNGAIWNVENAERFPYLKAKEMTTKTAVYTAEELQTEEGFDKFIKEKNSAHFEAEEGWYRWNYQHNHMETIAEKLVSRLEKYPNYVFTSLDGENYGNEPLEEGFVITDIRVNRRGVGGTIEEILVITDKGQFLVKNEYHIRAVLADGESRAILQNDNSYACGNLLPSAFFVIDVSYEDEKVTSIQLTGGGFGHGVGMSQNGAKNLADRGYSAEDILEFYYEGCEVRE